MYKDPNNEWVLVDYKTDKDASKEALVEKHSRQLNLYRYAVENITKTPVSRMVVVSLRTGEAVDIPKKEAVFSA